MPFKKHPQKPSRPSRRAQRCLSFAIVFILILFVGFATHNSWPRKADLILSTSTYGSSPEAGRPSLPFADNSKRKSTEDPFFETDYLGEYDGHYEYDEVAQPEPRELAPSEILTREELMRRRSH